MELNFLILSKNSMKDLIRFIIEKITGANDFDIEEKEDERGSLFIIHSKPELIGLIIGKGGKTIKNIRRIASIKGVLENKAVSINVENS